MQKETKYEGRFGLTKIHPAAETEDQHRVADVRVALSSPTRSFISSSTRETHADCGNMYLLVNTNGFYLRHVPSQYATA